MSDKSTASDTILVSARKGATTGILTFHGIDTPCALGRNGIVTDKREGDGGTPIGTFPLRELRFRADRVARPQTGLSTHEIRESDGWCDAPGDRAYNRFVIRPYPASSESLWRDDLLYDIVIMLGYNDAPVVDGRGSAIFFHLAKEKEGLLQPTEGCVALPLSDMQQILKSVTPATTMTVKLVL
jgi:L,D-peptidoglycan transpeptidase YkuD (ErfK/YbiS/YcfS/YnhG family)